MSLSTTIFQLIQSKPSVTALVGDRVVPLRKGLTVDKPAIVYSRRNAIGNPVAASRSSVDVVEIAFTVFGDDSLEVETILNALRDAIECTTFSFGEINIPAIFWDGESDTFDNAGDLYGSTHVYQFHVTKSGDVELSMTSIESVSIGVSMTKVVELSMASVETVSVAATPLITYNLSMASVETVSATVNIESGVAELSMASVETVSVGVTASAVAQFNMSSTEDVTAAVTVGATAQLSMSSTEDVTAAVTITTGGYNAYLTALNTYADNNTITKPSSPYLDALNTLMQGWDDDGLLAVADVITLYATENGLADWSKLNIVDPGNYTAVFVNSPTLVAKQGIQGDGISAYVSIPFNPATAGGNYSSNDASFGVYVYTKGSNVTSYSGCDGGSNNRLFENTTMRCSLNDNDRTSKAYTNTVIQSRTSAGTKKISADGATPSSHSLSETSVPNATWGDLSLSDGAASLSDGTVACRFIGGGLTDAQMQSFHTRLATYLSTIASL